METKSYCKNCAEEVMSSQTFCANCGFPQNSDTDTQQDYFEQRAEHVEEFQELEKDVNKGRSILKWLIGLASFVLLFAFTSPDIIEERFQIDAGVMQVTVLILALVYIGLLVWSKKNPFPAFVVALIIIGTNILSSLTGPINIIGLAIQGVFFFILFKAAQAAKKMKDSGIDKPI